MPDLNQRERELIAITIEKVELAVFRASKTPSYKNMQLCKELARIAQETRNGPK